MQPRGASRHSDDGGRLARVCGTRGRLSVHVSVCACVCVPGCTICVLMCTHTWASAICAPGRADVLPYLCARVVVRACGTERKRTVGPESPPVLARWGPVPDAGAAALRSPVGTPHFLSAVRLSTGVLLDVQKFFEISDSRAGLLQTGKG